tara:strand:- start:1383 stop:1559 length:177 start_codon:yes stop_codon:yes gene_type:complete
MDEIIQAIEEIEDMLIEATGGELPDEWRVTGQTGEEAFCAVVLNPLMDITRVVLSLTE